MCKDLPLGLRAQWRSVLLDFVLIGNFLAVGDYKEGYYIGVEPMDDPDAEKPFYGPNVWPASGNLFDHLLVYMFSMFCSINFIL